MLLWVTAKQLIKKKRVSPLSIHRAQRDRPQIRAEFGKLRNVGCNLKESERDSPSPGFTGKLTTHTHTQQEGRWGVRGNIPQWIVCTLLLSPSTLHQSLRIFSIFQAAVCTCQQFLSYLQHINTKARFPWKILSLGLCSRKNFTFYWYS